MSNWPSVALKDLATSDKYSVVGGPFGSKLGSGDYVPEGVPVLRGTNLPLDREIFLDELVFVTEEKVETDLFGNLAYPGDIVVTQRGTLGQVGLLPSTTNSAYDRYVVSQSQMKLTVDPDKADNRFVYYMLRSQGCVRRMQDLGMSSGVPHINLDTFRNFEIRLPDLEVQRTVSSWLLAYDDLIENNRRRIEILEEMARLIYREWFVHFRFPGHEDVELVDSDLGPIPEGWRVRPFSEVLEMRYGKALKADNRRGGDVAVYGSGGIVGWHDEALVEGPGIVVGRKGNVGAVYWSDGDFYPIDTTYFVASELPLSFAYHQLKTLEFIDSHAAVPGLSRNQAYALDVVVPPVEVLTTFDRAVGSMYALRRNLISQNDVLGQARDLLLPRLISGELDVSELDLELHPVA